MTVILIREYAAWNDGCIALGELKKETKMFYSTKNTWGDIKRFKKQLQHHSKPCIRCWDYEGQQ